MRHSSYKWWLVGLCLLLSIFIIKSVSAEDDVAVNIKLPQMVFHTSRLHTLNLWQMDGTKGTLQVKEDDWKKRLQFTNWLIVWKTSTTHTVGADKAVIGWWEKNTVSADYAWIGWGQENKAKSSYDLIWWWYNNEANWVNAVIVWWNSNGVRANSVVVWWNSNEGIDWGVVLWWKDNDAYNNSLALGYNATWRPNSFAWNGEAGLNSGYIKAESWILIGTTSPINWVNLVVNGGVKVAWKNNGNAYKWEIRYVWGCFYAFDGDKWHIINRGTEKAENDADTANNRCEGFNTDLVAQYCKFGNTVVWHNDTVKAFAKSHVVAPETCTKVTLTCRNGDLRVSNTQKANNYYAYCYQIQK